MHAKKNNRSLTLKAFSFTQFYYFTLTLLVTHTFSINPFFPGAFVQMVEVVLC